MGKKLVVALIVIFLLVMGALSIKVSSAPQYGLAGKGLSGIGVIEVNGLIGASGSYLGTDTSSAGQIMKAVREAREREDIKAVVLRVNSPGGAAGASQEIAIELDKLRDSGKPVVTSMGDSCASGGYWIACSTDYIIANGTSITGSIGVIMELTNLQELFDKLGIRQETIKSGVHKDMGSAGREMTEQERAIFQDMIDDSYQQFLDQVRQGRKGKITEEKLLEIADGRMFTGRQAMELGIVDGLGNYYDAIEKARDLGGLSSESKVEVLNANKFWEEIFLSYDAGNVLGELISPDSQLLFD